MKKKRRKVFDVIRKNIYMLSIVKKASKWFILFSIIISITALVDTFSNTWFSKIVFDSMENRSSFSFLLLSIIVLFVFMTISAIVKNVFYKKYYPKENQTISGYIHSLVFNKIHELDLIYFENTDFYNKYTRALTEADERAMSLLNTISELSYSIVTLLTLFSIIVYLDPILLAFAVSGAILSALISKKLSVIRYKYNFDKTQYDRKISYINRIFYEPQYSKDLKIGALHLYFVKFYSEIVKNITNYIKNRTNKIAFWEFISGIQNIVLQILMTIFLTWRVYNDVISIGDYAALLNSTFALMFQLQSFSSLIPKFYEHSLYIDNLKEIMDIQPNIEQNQGIELRPDEPLLIEFKNVGFSYPNSARVVLNNINLTFFSGKKHAIVGHNGAGKSTIIKLILRLYDVTFGEILINGINIKNYNVYSLRKNIATIFQDFQIYSIPISDYIMSSKFEEKSDEEMLQYAIRNVGLEEKINSLSNGIQTVLSKEFDENGAVLSGGENQKLAMAKAIAQNANTFIMDEPSSALDPISEYELNQNMIKIAKGKTVILISHRLSTTKDADLIYYIENGSVKESGDHDKLIKMNGKYAKMFNMQAESYL